MASSRRTERMEDDQAPLQAHESSDEDDIRELSPDEELDADINNLSIEDSVAGPVVRISDDQVSLIPDSQPIHNTISFEKPFAISYNDEPNKITNDHNAYPCTNDDTANLDVRNADPDDHSESLPPLRRPLFSNSPDERNSPPRNHNIAEETPFSSATDIVTDKNTGAISKSTLSNSSTKTIPELPRGVVPITTHFRAQPKSTAKKRNPPNICTWSKDKTPVSDNTGITSRTTVTSPADTEPLPQRPARKRGRRNSSGASITNTSTNNPPRNDTTVVRPTTNTGTLVESAQPPTTTTSATIDSNQHTLDPNAKNVSFSLQGGSDEYLPIPAEGLPFFRRARGCFSAEARANSRADHLDRLVDNGKPPRWAFGIGSMPSYVQHIANDLLNIKRRHSLEITRAVARSLRESSLASRRQGKLNLDTVQTIYANNGAGFEQAATKLTALVSRDNGQETERLSRREELISRSPTTDEDIVNLLSGFKIASKSYAGAVANDPPQANVPGNQAAARQGNDAGRQRQNRRSRSRSRSRNRNNARRNNDNNNRRNSRSPMRPRDNRRPDDNIRQNNRAANQGRRQDNRRQQRNRFRERDSAAEIMEKISQLLLRR